MSKKKKFKQKWSSQTDLGNLFGLSALAVGKILIENGLKDAETKLATKKAVKEGFAKSTPLKDGTPYFMWSKGKIKSLIAKDHQSISRIEFWVNEVKKQMRRADRHLVEGEDKLASLTYDVMFDDVPGDIKEEVEKIIDLGQ